MMSSDKLYQEWNCSDFTKITPISKLEEEIRLKFYKEGDSSFEYYQPIVTIMDRDNSCRYKNFLDSSIWFFMCDESKANLSCIEEKIKKNRKRYWLKCAIEYRDFYSRMLANDFVNGDHKKFVFPFLFHSEQELKRKKEDAEHKEIINEIKKYKWRILLIDDHTLWEDESGITPNPLTPKWYTQGAGRSQKMRDAKLKDILNPTDEKLPTKLDIVVEELCELFGTETITTDCQNEKAKIYIECASTLEEAKNKLKEKKYEIILLDYLLGEKGDGREYGYELLKGIWYKENEKKFEKARKEELEKLYKEVVFDYKKGPDNRLYFMFISAFTTAVSERLLTEGWLRSEDYWYIGEGACPVNTPYLFQYRLLHIMEKRMKDMGLSKMLYVNRNDFEKSYIKTNIIDVIYAPNDKNVRQSANEHFNDILSLLYNYKNLLVDTHNASNPFESPESTLATVLVMKNAYIGGFLEHLTQLVYLTAFGTVRQWSEMWEEYQFIKSIVGKIDSVEEYIFNLKNNNI